MENTTHPNIIIETERLILREILPTDVDGMFELDSDPDVHLYLGNQPVHHQSEIKDVIEFIRQQYVDNGIGRWAIIEKKTNAFVGWAGLKYITEQTNHHIHYYDLGYRLIKRYWGQGIAPEAAKSVLDYAFDKMELTEVYAMADCNNDGSNHILQKLGFQLIERFDDEGVAHNWYRIIKQQWP